MRHSDIQILSKKPLCFSVNSELIDMDNRCDVWFFHPRYKLLFEEIQKSKYQMYEIGDKKISINVVDGIHKTPDYDEGGLPFIQVNNIHEGEIDFIRNIKYVSKEWGKDVLARYQPKNGDVLITKDGTIGIAAVVPDDHPNFSIFVSVASIRPNKKYVIPKYLETVLNTKFGREQIIRYTRGAVLAHLLLEEIKKIKIPLPPLETQRKIAKIMNDAYDKKKEKVTKAENLLRSINELITRILNVKISSSHDKIIYSVRLNDNPEARLDPIFYHPNYIKLLKEIEKTDKEVKSLRCISKEIVSGQRPKGGVKYIEDGIPSIGGEHITSEGDFNWEDIKYVPKEFHKDQKKSWVKPFDILIVKDGATTGKVAIVTKEFPFKICNINEHVFRIEAKSGYNPYFIFSYLLSILGQEQIKRLISGAAQKGITRDAIEGVKIIIPPAAMQAKIAEDVKRIKEEAKKLRKKAEEFVEKAKAEVERIILGK